MSKAIRKAYQLISEDKDAEPAAAHLRRRIKLGWEIIYDDDYEWEVLK